MNSQPLITVHDLKKRYIYDGHKLLILDRVNFTVDKGEFICIIGPSGSGKSTLLRLMAQLDKPNSGAVERKKNLELAMIFQNFALFPWLTVTENIAFGLKMQEAPQTKLRHQVIHYIKEMGLSDFAEKHPRELSGGMRQRVGIARAMAIEPDILFMDEPFSSLDSFTANKLRHEMLNLWHKKHMTVVMVTHLVEEAVEMADRIVVFTPRPGKVKEIIEVPIPRPRNKRSDDFYNLVDKIEQLIVDDKS